MYSLSYFLLLSSSIPPLCTSSTSYTWCCCWCWCCYSPTTEEVLRSGSAIWMSSDGYLMLYGTFNDTHVEEQKFTWYGAANSVNGNGYLYPEIRSLRYEFFLINSLSNALWAPSSRWRSHMFLIESSLRSAGIEWGLCYVSKKIGCTVHPWIYFIHLQFKCKWRIKLKIEPHSGYTDLFYFILLKQVECSTKWSKRQDLFICEDHLFFVPSVWNTMATWN